MSLIEQAVRRLAELRRSGADPSDAASDVLLPADYATSDVVPVPEAMVRALEARGDLYAGASTATVEEEMLPPAQARRAAIARSENEGRAKARPKSTATPAKVRQIELDLNRLAARGFVTPLIPHAQIADEFRIIKRPILQNALGKGGAPRVRDGNLVMVTSSLPREGKTFTAVNLAISIAMEYDNTVLLVDGDVVHPGLPGLLGTPPGNGLLELLTQDDLDVSDVIIKTNIAKLSIIPAGQPQRSATELLASEQMAHLLREISTRYSDRIVIFDSPPLLATTESRILASRMGQIVMVVAAHDTSQHTLKQAMATIEGCGVVLMMLNKSNKTDLGAYYGYKAADAVR